VHLRVDPSVRIGVVLLYFLRIVRQADNRVIAEYRPQNGFDKLCLAGTAKWLHRGEDHWAMESYGNDPQLFLPAIEGSDQAQELLVEISLQEMGISEYIAHRERPPVRRSLFSRLKALGIVGLVMAFCCLSSPGWGGGVPVILDTDISSDVDDVGAVAVLHSLANEGKAEILAMMVSAVNPTAASCLQALNNYFGRPGVPVGTIFGKGVADESKYTAAVSREFAAAGRVEHQAVALYREVLSRQPDSSVVVVTIGYLTNLRNLLESGPDDTSPLAGTELVARKVKKLVTMGGQYPKGREWNFYQDGPATAKVVADWPTPILFVGFESGVKVLTGSGLRDTPVGNPLRRSYELYNGLTDRPSWDQVTVLYAVEGVEIASHSPLFRVVGGANTLSADGSNVWRENGSGRHHYSVNNLSDRNLAAKVEKLMSDAVLEAAR